MELHDMLENETKYTKNQRHVFHKLEQIQIIIIISYIIIRTIHFSIILDQE